MLLDVILALSRLIRVINSYKISESSKTFTTKMHESTLDLFCDHEDQKNEIDNAFDMALEELAAKHEVTVDYFMMEFL
jgi:Fe2+ or Zn2+ uptake regulation protein